MRTKKIAMAALLMFSSLNVHADLIVISDADYPTVYGTWDVLLLDGTFDELQSTLTTQAWWNDNTLAQLFASALGIGSGNPGIPSWGPLFAVSTSIVGDLRINAGQVCTPSGCDVAYQNASNTKQYAYATASRVQVPEPGGLALLAGGLLALGALRRRRGTADGDRCRKSACLTV